MSDDEEEKKAFQPVLSKTSTDGSSTRDRVVSHARDDRAEYVHDYPYDPRTVAYTSSRPLQEGQVDGGLYEAQML